MISRKTGKVIVLTAIYICPCVTATAQSPYAIFGDNSKMLEAQDVAYAGSIYHVNITSDNGTTYYADFDMKRGVATLSDMKGNVIQQDSISENDKARFMTIDPLCERYCHISPYAYCGGDPINRVDLHGDSITFLDKASIYAVYNALQPGTHLSMRFKNGVLMPESIKEIASSSEDVFLQDLYNISIDPRMVEVITSTINDYYIGNQLHFDQWGIPKDADDAKELNHGQETLLHLSGRTIRGNIGQTLYPNSSDGVRMSTNNNVRININAYGNINHRSCSIAHEFGHVILYFMGLPHSHSNNADFIYGRQWNVMKRFGYDYVESPSGTIFR